MTAGLSRWWFTLLILGTVLLLRMLPEPLQLAAHLEHQAINNGQWWRLLSCHLVHLSNAHTALNIVAYGLLAYCFRDEITARREAIILIASAAVVGLGIHTLNPEMYSYAGLSGAFYGSLVAFAFIALPRVPIIALGFLGFVTAKFIYEAIIGGASPQTEALIGGKVATSSHWYGSVCGLMLGVGFFISDQRQRFKYTNVPQSFKPFQQQFQEQRVNDLAWVLGSPSLIKANIKTDQIDKATLADYQSRLEELDKNPTPLNALKTGRLGVYFESLLAFWLNDNAYQQRYRCVAHNLAVHDTNKQTLGEFDFIVANSTTNNTLEHWEVAVKFYLGVPQVDGSNHWVGPNKNDTLERKLTHLVEHQLRLSEHPAAQRLLHESLHKNLNDTTLAEPTSSIEERRLFVKGQLFYHWRSNSQIETPFNDPLPALNPEHLRGYWYHQTDFIRHFNPLSAPGYPWQSLALRFLDQQEWLALQDHSGTSVSEFKQQLRSTPLEKPRMAAAIRHGMILRIFIVPDRW